jgi:hypothetical protein
LRPVAIKPRRGEERQVIINQATPMGVKNDMSKLSYDIEIESGISFAAQKAASLEMLTDLIKNNPTLAPLLSDLMAESLDLSNSAQIVNRIQKMLMGESPAQILAEEKGLPVPQAQPNPEAQLQQEELKLKQADLTVKNKQAENAAVQNQLESAKLMNEAVSNHATHIQKMTDAQIHAMDTRIRSAAEIEKEALQTRKTAERY